jgi:hypothetical protein
MALNDTGPAPTTQLTGLQPQNFQPGGEVTQYDANGYPLPPKAAQDMFKDGLSFPGKYKPGQVGYDPNMGPAEPDGDNPYPAGSQQRKNWDRLNKAKKTNEIFKAEWNKQHETQRQQTTAQPTNPQAPSPFQSSGIDLTKQGKGESYTDSILQHYADAGIPQVGNESKTTLDKFRSSQPANMDPYYDYASQLTSAKIDNAMASRGSYGSSNATGQIGAAEVALRAQQARDNASYGLQRFAQEGQFAGAADQQGNVGNGIQYQWTKGLADMANNSQNMGQDRNQQLWNNNFALAAAKAGNYGSAANSAISGVTGATDAANNALMGSASDALSNANANANRSNAQVGQVLDAANTGLSNYTRYNSGQKAGGN